MSGSLPTPNILSKNEWKSKIKVQIPVIQIVDSKKCSSTKTKLEIDGNAYNGISAVSVGLLGNFALFLKKTVFKERKNIRTRYKVVKIFCRLSI